MSMFISFDMWMTKKEYILKVLDKFGAKWDKTQSIRKALLDDVLTDDYIAYLYGQFVKIIDTIKSSEILDKTNHLQHYLNGIQELEFKEREAELVDIKKLEEILRNL